MPAKKRKTKARGLSVLDHMKLVLCTGCNHWPEDEWARMRALWEIHGERLMREAVAKGEGPPMLMPAKDRPKWDALVEAAEREDY